MSDRKQDTPLVVSEFTVPTKSNERKIWRKQIKEMTAPKFAAGHTSIQTQLVIGLPRRWADPARCQLQA